MKKSSKKINYIRAIGRRREASVRVRLFSGKGENLVNEKKESEYFPGLIASRLLSKPFDLTDLKGKYYYTAKVVGGGKNGQLEALALGISRAIVKLSTDKYRFILKKAGLLTRDSRAKLRRMVGTGGKARRKKQSPKR
jgi:small subunit ribosomal protein S9